MATNDIYEIIDYQAYYDQKVENVYTYRRNSASFVDTVNPTVAGSILQSWISKILPFIRAVQSDAVIHTAVTCRNLFSEPDAADTAMSLAGTGVSGGDDLPAFNAFSLKLNTAGLAVKNGSKRVAGVVETGQTDGVVTDPTVLLRLGQLSAKLLEGVRFSADIPTNQIAALTIVKRVRSGVAGSYEYRLPENQGESVWADVVAAAYKFILSSQVSRKVVGTF